VQANRFVVQSASGVDDFLIVTPSAGVDLRHNASGTVGTKLSTTSTGIDVTGTVTADGLTSQGTLGNWSIDSQGAIQTFTRASTNYIRASNASGALRFDTGGSNARLNIASNGDISFYEDTGTTPKFFWDASAESLGIGTSSPANTLHVQTSSSGATPFSSSPLVIERSDVNLINMLSANDTDQGILFGDVADNDIGGLFYLHASNAMTFRTNTAERLRIDSAGQVGIGCTPSRNLDIQGTGDTLVSIVSPAANQAALFFGDTDSDSVGRVAYDNSDNSMRFNANGSEAMRIDSSGNLLVGKSSSSFTTAGVELAQGGTAGKVQIQRSSSPLSLVNLTDDGSILNFYKGTSAVGSIGTIAGYLTTGTSDTGVLFHSGEDSIQPWNIGTNAGRDNAISLGASNARFKDLYLSGDIFVGNGTSAIDANKVYIQDSASTESARVTIVGNNSAGGALLLGGRSDTGGATVLIRPDGDLENANNSYGAISDQRLKQDIVDATSQWDDIKAMRVRKYRFKSDPEAALQIGLVAQELEESSPGLVRDTDDDINYGDIEGPIKTVKYSLVYMKAIKALQEAMDRIETLEAKVAQLEGAN
jgi:hypothetical protein